MFTGIVSERGRVASVEGGEESRRLEIEAPQTAAQVSVGDSVSISGCCLTATAIADGRISFEAVPETLRRSTLGALAPGDEVNLERALRAGEPLGGHYVQGHVDAVGRVVSIEREGGDVRLWVEAPAKVLRYCVEKGSIALEGVALTIADIRDDSFAVALVPYTLEHTTLARLATGDEVNLEVDVLAKYVEKLVARDTISRA